MQKLLKTIILVSTLGIVSACSTFFDKDNTPAPAPLVNFTPSINVSPVWYANATSGSGKDYLKLTPAIAGDSLFAAGKDGDVIAMDKRTGQSVWQTHLRTPISAGATAEGGQVYVGLDTAELAALNQSNGQPTWKAQVTGEILAPAAANSSTVLAKTIDGEVTALSSNDGNVLWRYQQTEPTLVLRASSAPQITTDNAVIGFENGMLVKLSLNDGTVIWQQRVAVPEGSFAIERMVDIDANPVVTSTRVYVASYQGQIMALSLSTGQELWSHTISSYSGLAADDTTVYVSDANGSVFALDADSGEIKWKQNDLFARRLTGPVIMGNHIVVGDEEGFLHWLNTQDGSFAARAYVNDSGIIASPVISDGILYALSRDGHLGAFRTS